MQTLAVIASRAHASRARLRSKPWVFMLVAAGCMVLFGGLAVAHAEEGAEIAFHRIGPTATVVEVSTGLPFAARVDTGARLCSIHCEAMEIEDASPNPRDNVGKPIRFLIKNDEGASEWIESRIADRVVVRTAEVKEGRYSVQLDLRWEDVEKKVRVTLNDRQGMNYPLLLGRNFLRGDFLVDLTRTASQK